MISQGNIQGIIQEYNFGHQFSCEHHLVMCTLQFGVWGGGGGGGGAVSPHPPILLYIL